MVIGSSDGTFPSRDCHVRLTKVKIKNRECLRSIDGLILLELTIAPDVLDQRTGVRRGADDSSSDVNQGPEKLLQSRYRRLLKRRVLNSGNSKVGGCCVSSSFPHL
ncbi:hypothetical protein NPIL_165901 [Nephila pilipes]|uniref:Uncharacterized protein n=1 Tax=Nephila pilipes TaxID=299642 RepID=A0A8X6QVU9_NEPPI|nr:hypothetical protein NPIL_165901 [Nephila pilipes]